MRAVWIRVGRPVAPAWVLELRCFCAVAMTDDHSGIWTDYETDVSAERIESAREEAGPGQVVCLECGRTFGQITEQHLRVHGTTLGEYETEHPDAPVYPDASDRQPGRDPGFTHTEETKQKIGEGAKRNHERGVYE